MKKYMILIAAILAVCLLGCTPEEIPEQTTEATIETAPTETTAAPTTEATEPPTGWQELNGKRYYLFPDGTHPVGWFEDGEDVYYIAPNGFAHTGWLELEGQTLYFREDGTMARGEVEIDGVKHHFTADGSKILLVNPWNYVPEGYDPELVEIPHGLATQNMKVAAECYDALIAMLEACNRESPRVCVVSAYRTHDYQARLYKNKVTRVEAQGYSHEEALIEAAKVVAIPGTSEHQLGLAVDIVDTRSYDLTDIQETLPAQQWLMAHSWEYGFILRYPNDKTSVTGIIYEPWHYRYVGTELAKELYDAGLTLEEYLQNLTQ